MKCMIPEISWHNKEPVLCADFQPIESDCYKLATGGADCHLLIWQANILNNGAVAVDMVADLTRHQRAVNAVRWSPNGQYLASGDDDANIIIWNLKTDIVPLLEGEINDKEIWIVTKILRGHKEDIYDLCWSPNGAKLLSGSIDNTAIIWDFAKGKIEMILSDHKAFVQGVAWDPKGQFIATLSSDRMCRVYESKTKQIKARIGKGALPVPKTHILYNKDVKYFHDDTFKSYFRRVQFSTDGNLLITPCGCVETDDCKKALNATFLFTLDSLTQPAAILPLTKQCSIAVRCCPILFELRSDGPDPIIDLPYRMVIAVATDNDIILYDTQQLAPFAHFQKIHYTRLTDLTWSVDGRVLLASSTDGFCTFITFETNELGNEYVKEESEHEESTLNISGCEELGRDDGADKKENVLEDKPRKSNFLMKWANQAQSKVSTDNEPARKRLKMDPPQNKEKKEKSLDLALPGRTENSEHMSTGRTEDMETDGKLKLNLLAKLASEKRDRTESSTETIDLTSPVKINGDKDVKINKITPKRIIPTKVTGEQNVSCSSKTITPTSVKKKAKTVDVNYHKNNVKSSSLLTFLKAGKTPGKPKLDCKNVKSGTQNDAATPTITILDESEARDAWKCDENGQALDKVVRVETKSTCPNESSDLTDTIPPDFKLQIEESTLESHGSKSNDNRIDGNIKLNIETNQPDISSQKETQEEINRHKIVDSSVKLNVETDHSDISSQKEMQGTSQSHSEQEEVKRSSDRNVNEAAEKENTKLTNESEVDLESKGDDSVRCVSKKTGRRIPLITLSSPKTKKQRLDT